MRFGFSVYPFSRYPDPDAILETVQMCEKLGFYSTSLGEHVIVPQANAATLDSLYYDNVALAAMILARTTLLKVFFNVVVMPYHHPIQLAKSIATLDIASKGRVIMGAGVGWTEGEFQALGIPFRERGARTDEYLRACKALWTSDTPSFEGRFVSFRDVVFRPRPYTRPHPPIWIGGASPRTVQRAAALGDGFAPLGGPMSKLERLADETRALLEQAGRDPAAFTFAHACDVGGTVSHHSREAGGNDSLVLGPEPGRLLEQVEAYRRAGYSHIALRFPQRELPALHDAIRQFAETVKLVPRAGAL